MRLTQCLCDEDLLVRIPRSVWMRTLLPSRWHYYCWSCHRKMLIPPLARAQHSVPAVQHPLAGTPAMRA